MNGAEPCPPIPFRVYACFLLDLSYLEPLFLSFTSSSRRQVNKQTHKKRRANWNGNAQPTSKVTVRILSPSLPVIIFLRCTIDFPLFAWCSLAGKAAAAHERKEFSEWKN